MRTYRDYLDEKRVPRGPWVLSDDKPLNEKGKVVPLRKVVDKSA